MCTLEPADHSNVRDVWEIVFADAPQYGKEIIIRLFVTYPNTVKYFKHFKDAASREALEKNPRVTVHAKRVMTALDKISQNVHDWDEVVNIFTPLAEKHRDVHHVDVHNFKLLFEVILGVFQDALGEAFTKARRESWVKLFDMLFGFLQYLYADSV
ncbi:putative globin-like domain containing protein [Namao virus]|nr:putative globin-like domain containing protein [Namao virus]